ncbi:ComF family protein [Tepidanaerobacter sp. GT38]|uniref:ComF family protein n=1 Tax=Tepidanaerobacter sp. GT38 TaxID=2722793 RepID=UPI001F190E38|nr:ComF family protein [Tepidanaerobacter sp. GT38]MCG1011207.1 ComF family protein [Tepidanaerobacter sp. GT38]
MIKSAHVANLFLNLLFPQKPYCLICSKKLVESSLHLCQQCRDKIIPLSGPLCDKCGKPLQIQRKNMICQDCQEDYHAFVQARSYGHYSGILKQLINEFKYHGKPQIAEVLGNLMFDVLRELPWPIFDYIVPIPLHAARQRERGFNQAYLLSKVISRQSGIPIFCGLIRIKPTEHQTLLDKTLRKENLKGAFKAVNTHKIQDKTLLLIDDVYTTGATSGECSKCLVKAGAKAVYVLTCARG